MNHKEMSSTTCSGCTACMAACPQNAISFKTDKEGFKIPNINKELCVDCGKCVRVCPALNCVAIVEKAKNTYHAYAFQYKNNATRGHSASGALFPAFAYSIIEDKKGYVCGCVLDEHLSPKHIVSNNITDIARMQDSKYVQSDMQLCLKEVAGLLKDNQWVLFSGTSCQVKGLYNYLSLAKIQTETLLSIDFFCHGVPSPQIWNDYIKFYEKKKGGKVQNFRFRNKKYGWGVAARGTGFLSTIEVLRYPVPRAGFLKKDSISYAARMWPKVFFSNLCLRQYCYQCPYTNIDKPADVTMGDFWGIQYSHPEFDDHLGCSMAIIRSEKAERLLKTINQAEILEVSIDEIVNYQANAFTPSKLPANRARFWDDYSKGGFETVAQSYFGYNFKYMFKNYIKFILFKLHCREYEK